MTDVEGLQNPGVSRGAHVAPVVPRTQLRIISEHRCSRHHRDSAHFARCAWPGAVVSGRGPLALVISCPDPRVLLVERVRWAHVLRAEFATFGCGPLCAGEHELVGIDIDGPEAA